jgi:uncharacterized protein (TIGR02265 family)
MKYLRAQERMRASASCGIYRRRTRPFSGECCCNTWYSADLMRLEMTIAAILARGDRRALFLDMGQFSADTNLSTSGLQRAYVRKDDPHFLLRNVPRMYSAQHSDGTRTYEQTGAFSAVLRTMDGEPPHAEDCLTAIGWLRRAIEISGGRAVQVEEAQCRANGASCCEYRCSWA